MWFCKSGMRWCVLCAALCLFARFTVRAAPTQQSGESATKVVLSPDSPVPAQDSGSAEDFSSLSLHGRSLPSERPLLAEKADLSTFTRETLEVKWRPDDPIHLYVILPKGVEKPPVVLYLYSYPSETDRFRDDDFCEHATKGGVAAVGFVSALTGHRYHDVPMKKWFVSELDYSLTASVHDVQMILNYLAARGDVDMNHVGMFGQGSGGSIALLAAAVDPRIKVVDALNPWGDWPDWMAKSARVPDAERPDYVKPEFLNRVAPLDPVVWLPKLKPGSVRIVDAMDDAFTPFESKKQIEAAAQKCSAQIKAYDQTKAMHDELSGGKLFEWIKQQVRLGETGNQIAEQHP